MIEVIAYTVIGGGYVTVFFSVLLSGLFLAFLGEKENKSLKGFALKSFVFSVFTSFALLGAYLIVKDFPMNELVFSMQKKHLVFVSLFNAVHSIGFLFMLNKKIKKEVVELDFGVSMLTYLSIVFQAWLCVSIYTVENAVS